MFAYMGIHMCVTAIQTNTHTHKLHKYYLARMHVRKLMLFFWLLAYTKHLRYRVSIHAASPKARVVHQGFHHLRHLHIIWPIIAVNIRNIINTNTHSNISVCNNVFNLISHRRSNVSLINEHQPSVQNVNKTVQKA